MSTTQSATDTGAAEAGAAETAACRGPRADAQRNRAKLIEAARQIYAAQGADASLESIARAAGVGIGTLYRHFPSREALITAVFQDAVDSACARADELLTSPDPDEALLVWLREQMDQASACRGLAAEAMIMMLDTPGGQVCDAMRTSGAALLARAQELGHARASTDIDDLVRLVSAIGIATEGAPDREVQADRLFALVMDGVRR
jgi:AcrR family transcriptional regulator